MPHRPLRQRARNAVHRISGGESRELRGIIDELRDRLAEVDRLRGYLQASHDALQSQRDELVETGLGDLLTPEGLLASAPFLSWRPPGHFYSPVPDMRDVRRREEKIWVVTEAIPGVDLDEDGQRKRFAEIAALVADVDPPREPDPAWRYCTANDAFGIGDALVLNGMLRMVRPRRLIEVGSGWSSAWMLDTADRWLDGALDITCIEPFPELLRSVLRPGDAARVHIDQRPLQEVPTEAFQTLESGDVLFIDSTHVLKIDSDVRHVFARVLPAVPPGVYVHLHDIFWPFEYPYEWVRQGRAWNELYILEAFLQFNEAYDVVLWNDWLFNRDRDLLRELLPAMATNAGGSLWLRRRETG